MKNKKRGLFGLTLILTLLIAAATIIPAIIFVSASGNNSYEISDEQDNRHAIQKGLTLHCWNWSYKNISANMKMISEYGFSAIQTSPIQPTKESTVGKTVGSSWMKYYIPTGYNIEDSSENALGTRTEFENMCEVAHEYGIKVIVEVVDVYKMNETTKEVQQSILELMKDCVDCGVDGIKFDVKFDYYAYQNNDFDMEKDFWLTIIRNAKEYARETRNIELYFYGDVICEDSSEASLPLGVYSKYMSVSGVTVDSVEDIYTYMGSDICGTHSKNVNKEWAIMASKANVMGVYLARPYSTYSLVGSADITGWANAEVKAVNRFHNYFIGETEKISIENDIVYCERGTSGVVLVNKEGTAATVDVMACSIMDGSYRDQISGEVFVVCEGRIKGKIGSTGIAVVYNAENEPVINISQQGGKFASDSLTLDLAILNADSGSYCIVGSQPIEFTGETQLTIGADMSFGEKVNVRIMARRGSKEITKTYTFTKVDKSNNVAYIELPQEWDKDVKCYVYDAVRESVNNGIWPGAKMTPVDENLYMYQIPENMVEPRVIFYSSDKCRYPDENEPGLLIDGSMIYQDGKWQEYEPKVITYGKVLVRYVDESGKELSDSITLEGVVGETYKAITQNFYGYSLLKTNGKSSAEYTKEQIVVEYVYKKDVTEVKSKTAYLTKPSGWDKTLYCYVYSADNEQNINASWPGVKMNCENGVYRYEVPADISNPLVIFSDGKVQYPGAMQRGLELKTDMIYHSGEWMPISSEVFKDGNVAYFAKDENWDGDMYCYVYSAEDGVTNKPWPGVKMTHVSGNIYKYVIPKEINNPLVIFTDKKHQYPGSMQTGLPILGSMILENGEWKRFQFEKNAPKK